MMVGASVRVRNEGCMYMLFVHKFVCIPKANHFTLYMVNLVSVAHVLHWYCYIRGMESTQPLLKYQFTPCPAPFQKNEQGLAIWTYIALYGCSVQCTPIGCRLN